MLPEGSRCEIRVEQGFYEGSKGQEGVVRAELPDGHPPQTIRSCVESRMNPLEHLAIVCGMMVDTTPTPEEPLPKKPLPERSEVEIYWPGDGKWYSGKIWGSGYLVHYDDGEVAWETDDANLRLKPVDRRCARCPKVHGHVGRCLGLAWKGKFKPREKVTNVMLRRRMPPQRLAEDHKWASTEARKWHSEVTPH